MYKSLFKLQRDPFAISPDPQFLYPSEMHTEALAGLFYGIRSRKGLMVLTGEVGTGKTLVLRCLLDSLDQEKIAYAYIFHSLLPTQELLHYAMQSLGLQSPPTSRGDLLMRLNWFLSRRHLQGLPTVLVVDEAQHLSEETLEEIRLLTNLETPQVKLLQIILAGQPELDQKLESYQLRQFKQRIALRFQLEALSEQQVAAYVENRLKQAGGDGSEVFPSSAIQRIYHYSQGIPRLINLLCENCLISSFALGQSRVAPSTVDEVAKDLRMQPTKWPRPDAHPPLEGMTISREAAERSQAHERLNWPGEPDERRPAMAIRTGGLL